MNHIPIKAQDEASKSHFHSFSERMRPRSFEELAIPSKLKQRFSRMRENRVFQNMLFYGSPGTGKTTCANLLASDLDGFTVRRFNAGLDCGMSAIAEIRSYASTKQLFSNRKVFILDEADNISAKAQKALLSVIEDGSSRTDLDHSTKFILIANDARKIINPLKSRCLPVCFDCVGIERTEAEEVILKTAQNRLKEIRFSIDIGRLKQLVRSSFPDCRNISNRIEFELL